MKLLTPNKKQNPENSKFLPELNIDCLTQGVAGGLCTMVDIIIDMKIQYWFFISLVLIGWFYWFQYRPSNIRKECDNRAVELAHFDYVKRYPNDPNLSSSTGDPRVYKVFFEQCLNSKGL